MNSEPKVIFLSYASQDSAPAKKICEALHSAGIEVWFDAEGGLEHGDEWDAKIRRQIKECVLFIPIISANTQARHEGYFRIEWELAAQRAMGIAAGVPFILPVVIDDTSEPAALVPDRFRAVQWTRLRRGEVPPAVLQRFLKLWSHRAGGLKRQAVQALGCGEGRLRKRDPDFIPGSPRRGVRARVLRVVGGAAIAAVAAFWWRQHFAAAPPAKTTAATAGAIAEISGLPSSAMDKLTAPAFTPDTDPKSIVVLPFANLSGDPAQEYFSDGLTEEILNGLARERDLRVVPRTSAFSFKGKNLPLPDIAKMLNVARVVEGSVQRAGNRVRILCRLTRVADGYTEALPPFDRNLTDVFALEDEIARAVVEKLTHRATTAGSAGGTANVEAYDRFLRARARQLRNATGPSGYAAMREYEEVLRLDPAFALAWAQLAEVAAGLGNTTGGFDMSEATRHRAIEAADQAARLAPGLAEAHVARAVVCLTVKEDFDEAGRELAAAERLQPLSADLARVRASYEAPTASGARILALATHAVELDPQNPSTLVAMGTLLWRKGDFAAADDLLRRATNIGESQNAFLARGRNWAAWTGDVAHAIKIVLGCPEESRNELFYRLLAPLYDQTGDNSLALATWEKARTMAEKEIQTPGIRAAHAEILGELGRHLARAGDPRQARKCFDDAGAELDALLQEQPRTFNLVMRRSRLLAAESDVAGALSVLENVSAEEARPAAGNLTGIATWSSLGETRARLLAELGKVEPAVEQLRELQARGWEFGYTLRLTPEFKPLHATTAFQALMREAEAKANAMPHPKQ